jgi:hypothetical protein
MPRLLLLLAASVGIGGCPSSSYTIEAPSVSAANERAARYCGEQDATARLEGVRPQGNGEVQVYRCVER